MTRPIAPIARVASLNGVASVKGVAAGNIRLRRVRRGKSPVAEEEILFLGKQQCGRCSSLYSPAPRAQARLKADPCQKTTGLFF